MLPNVTVKVTSMETNAVRVATTDGGSYSVPSLSIGSYEVAVEAGGFKLASSSGRCG